MTTPSTNLELCQRTARECGVAGSGPAAVTGQTGEHARIVEWVNQAYVDVQNLHVDWDFLWGEGTLDLAEGVSSYADPFTNNNARQLDGPVVIYDTAIGDSDKSVLTAYDYRTFRERFLLTSRQSGRPTAWAPKPNESAILVDPVPDSDNYRLEYTYWRDTHQLSANSDIPLIPLKHRMIIVWGAVLLYAQYEEAVNLYQTARMEYDKALYALRQSHLPKRVITMRPLA